MSEETNMFGDIFKNIGLVGDPVTVKLVEGTVSQVREKIVYTMNGILSKEELTLQDVQLVTELAKAHDLMWVYGEAE